jgi:hypothetical protein
MGNPIKRKKARKVANFIALQQKLKVVESNEVLEEEKLPVEENLVETLEEPVVKTKKKKVAQVEEVVEK